MTQVLLLGIGLGLSMVYGYDSSFDMTLAEKYVHFSGAGEGNP